MILTLIAYAFMTHFSKYNRGQQKNVLYSDKINLGDYVKVDLKTSIQDSELLPYDQGLVHFVVNGGGFTPEIHKQIEKMNVGDKNEIIVAGGDYDEKMAADVPLSRVPAGLKSGEIVRFSNGLRARVIDVSETTVRLDANSPLAGKQYNVDLHLLERKPIQYLEECVFGAGCFWGVELAFQRMPGVCHTAVGYTQGQLLNPSYEDVCSGETGHVEAVKVLFDPELIQFQDLLQKFFDRHDPTQLNRQGNDVGTQYRSGIYYTSESQKSIALEWIKKEQIKYKKSIVTELLPAAKFWDAEDYHQRYLENGGQSAKKDAEEPIRCYG